MENEKLQKGMPGWADVVDGVGGHGHVVCVQTCFGSRSLAHSIASATGEYETEHNDHFTREAALRGLRPRFRECLIFGKKVFLKRGWNGDGAGQKNTLLTELIGSLWTN